MKSELRILHLEDDRDYVDFIRATLEQNGFAIEIVWVETIAAFTTALEQGTYDFVLADFKLRSGTGLDALKLARAAQPNLPFLMLSGTIGEELAVEALRLGASDYVLKQCAEKLIPVIHRILQEAEERTRRLQAERALAQRETYFRSLIENSLDVIIILDAAANVKFASPSTRRVLGVQADELVDQPLTSFVHGDEIPAMEQCLAHCRQRPETAASLEFRFHHRNGSWRYLEAVVQSHLDHGEIGGIVLNARDITERKHSENELRASEQQYRLLFDDNPNPMWVFDKETLAFLEVNESAIRHYGYSRDEFLAMTVADIRPPEDRDTFAEYWRHAKERDQAEPRMWRHVKKDRNVIDVEIKRTSIRFGGREAALTLVTDVTEKFRAEMRDLAFSKLGQRLSSTTSPEQAARIIGEIASELFNCDSLNLGLCSPDDHKTQTVLNWDTSDGKHFEMSVVESDSAIAKMMRRAMDYGAELVTRDKRSAENMPEHGETVQSPASLMFTPIRNRNQVIGILSIHSRRPHAFFERDLLTLQTLADHCAGALERIRAEKALQSSEVRFKSVWENSVDGMRLTDENGVIVSVNEAFCQLVGMRREELEGKSFLESYAENEQIPELLRAYIQQFRERKVDRRARGRFTLRSGRTAELEIASSFIELEGRRPLLLGMFRDVTEQKRLEEQLRHSQKMEAVGQLAGGVAHDFNNILTVVQGHASLLLGAGNLPPRALRSAEQISKSATRAADLTRQLLTFSRRQVIQPKQLNLNEVIASTAQMLSRTLGEHITLKFAYASAAPLIQADAGMIDQILLNLVINARDAMPEGGDLSISVDVQSVTDTHLMRQHEARIGRFVRLSIADSGCGIDPKILPHIFEPFFTTKEVGKGTGLGLATVYGIVQQHQGWIEVSSELGRGTTFHVFLPVVETISETAEIRRTDEFVRGGTETVLIVEDEEPVRELVKRVLTAYGYNVIEASSGRHALALWPQCKDAVELLLTDIVMPDGINGRNLAEQLQAQKPSLKVIYTSGYSEDIVGKDFVLGNGLNFLQKPYQPKQLARTVRECLDTLASA